MKYLATFKLYSVALLAGFSISQVAYSASLIDDNFSRRAANSTSGSLHTVEGKCATGEYAGMDWQDATATLEIEQTALSSTVKISVRDAKPATVFTVWLRIKGTAANGNPINPGGSSLTGGGATPLASGADLPTLMANSPGSNPDGSPNPINGFTTDVNGNADWFIDLDFPVIGGAYPFNAVGAVPQATVNPALPGVGGPFFLRVISHCQDGAGHGLSPGQREAWFQYP